MANFVNGIVFIVPVLAYPTFGLLFDWTGYKLFWGMFAAIGTMSCHLICALTTPLYFIPIMTALLLGLFYSMFTKKETSHRVLISKLISCFVVQEMYSNLVATTFQIGFN